MYIIIVILAIVILFGFGLPGLSLAPWVPVRKSDLPRILDIGKLQPDESFYDLGCGNGRVVFYVSRKTEGRIYGVELSFFLYLICLIRNLFTEKKVKLMFNDLYRVDLGEADVVFVFSQSREKISGKLLDKLKREMKKGARVVSYVFPFASWEPLLVSRPSEKDLPIYLYKI
jgi:SAM-dependent methyltransferase